MINSILRQFRNASLRTKLILGNMLIILLSLVGVGIYIYTRSSGIIAFFSSQLDRIVISQAEGKLNTTSDEQATALNNFFVTINNDTSTIGATTGNLLSNEGLINSGVYWDALLSLSRLPNMSWDNPNTEIGSVFIPANKEMTFNLVSELNTIKQLDFTVPTILTNNPDITAIYFGGTSKETLYYPNVDLAAIVPPDFDVTGRPWYVNAAPAQNPNGGVVWSEPYLDAALNGLVVTSSIPVYDSLGTFRGVAAMDIQLNRITDIVSNTSVGNTGYAMLIDSNKRLIAMPEAGYLDFQTTADVVPLGETLDQTKLANTPAEFFDLLTKTASGESGLETITLGGVDRLIVYRPVPEVGYRLVIIVPASEMLAEALLTRDQVSQEMLSTITRTIILMGIILLIALIATLGIGSRLTSPLEALTKTAEEISNGNLEAKARIQGMDEIGKLGVALNSMTSSLKQSIQSLEQRVADRTQNLQLAADVGRSVSQVRTLDLMLKDAAEIIRSRFDLYYVQIYLTDPSQSELILQSGTGSVGAELIGRGHRLPFNTASINGRAAMTKLAVVVEDTAISPIFRPNPLLPNTRSEMAVPLLVGEKVVGILDLQSQNPNALNQEILPAFEALAGQFAIAIQNASFLAEAQRARAEVETQARNLTRTNWADYMDAIHLPEETGYEFKQNEVSPLSTDEPVKVGAIIAPISITGEPLGDLVVEMEGQPSITRSDELVRTVARQVAQQIENLRLIESAERYRAEAEQTSRRTTREGWKDYTDAAQNMGYLYDLNKVQPLEQAGTHIADGSALNLPLKIRDETIGNISIQGIQPSDKDSVDLASAVAERLGAHIESLRQFTLTQSALAQTEKLSVAGLRLARAADLQELLKIVMETLDIQVINRARLETFNYNPANENEVESMDVAANWWNGSGQEPVNIGMRTTANTFPMLNQFLSSDPLFTSDAFTDKRVDRVSLNVMKQQATHAFAMLPLFVGLKQIGIVVLESEQEHEFNQEETRLFAAMAPQIATVFENRRQFERAQKQAERETTLNIIGQKIRGATTVEAVLQIAARELGRALDAPLTIAQLGMKDKK